MAAYRAEKQRRWEAEQRRERLSGLYQSATGLFRRQRAPPAEATDPAPAAEDGPAMESPPAAADTPLLPHEERLPASSSGSSTLDWLILACKVGLYITLFSICCHFQFGAAYVLVTAFPIIYFR